MSMINSLKTFPEPVAPSIVLSALVDCATFSELVLASGGLHPTELLSLLKGLDQQHPALRRRVQDLVDDATANVIGGRHPQGAGLALPHPIDFEWRFTDGTADHLLGAAANATSPGDTILLMGVPSVVIAAAQSSHDRRFLVVGEHNVISKALRELTARDTRFDHTEPVDGKAAAAILDPPWYPEQFSNMLEFAASHCIIGAYFFLSAPSVSVRPSIPDDLKQIDDIASRNGLEIVACSAGKLKYRTPFFEMNALKAAGIGAWLPEWRSGEERIYRKAAHGQAQVCNLPSRSGFEITLAGVRLRLLDVAVERGISDLEPIHPGEIFPSVSMRAPRRSEAVLWTSGNRAFNIDYHDCLAALTMIAQDKGLLPEGLSWKISRTMKPETIDRIDPLIQKLLEVAEREFAEATMMLGRDTWETTANDARFLCKSRKSFP